MSNKIRLSEDERFIFLSNSKIQLKLSKGSGALLELADKVKGIPLIGPAEEVPTLVLTVGGKYATPKHPRESQILYTNSVGLRPKYEGHRIKKSDGKTQLTVTATEGDWKFDYCYTICEDEATVKRSFAISYLGEGEALLRQADSIIPHANMGDIEDCVFEAPGYPILPHYPLSAVPEGQWGETTRGGLWGDIPCNRPGLLSLRNLKSHISLMIWGYSERQPLRVVPSRKGDLVSFTHVFHVADRFKKDHKIDFGSQYIRVSHNDWRADLEFFNKWFDEVGLAAPKDTPEWGRNARLYEVHTGTFVWGSMARLSPEAAPFKVFDNLEELRGRLPYIQDLGFNIIQLMCVFPFPDYTVYDYFNVDVHYGSKDGLHRLVDDAHKRGMKVILDVTLHGIVNTRGRYYDAKGLPPPPFLEEHSEAFMKTEDGEIVMTYTFAFDHANEVYRQHLIDALKMYVSEYDVDGFRIDAPTWNFFPNWDPKISPRRASDSYYASVSLFKEARKQLKKIKPEVILYTEPGGPLWYCGFDMTYNYEEHWLYEVLLKIVSPRGYATWLPGQSMMALGYPLGRRVNARQVSEWLEAKRLCLPKGAIKVHHVDSHDSLQHGGMGQWRREAFGIQASRALFAFNALIDGGVMNYVNGEKGSEEFYKKILHIRNSTPAIYRGDCDYTIVTPSDEMVIAPLRSYNGSYVIPVVNFSDKSSTVKLSIPIEKIGTKTEARYLVKDLMEERAPGKSFTGVELSSMNLDLEGFQVRILSIEESSM